MRIPVIHFLVLVCFPLLTEAQTYPVDIGYAGLDISWDKAPLTATKFRNGDKIDIVNSNKQWFKNCASRKPSVWIYSDDSDGKKVYLYNFYAVKDERNLAPLGYEIPTKALLEMLNRDPQKDFPFTREQGKYLALDLENEKTEIVKQTFYFWTSSLHELTMEGAEDAIIGLADKNTRTLKSSTGVFCEGYPVVCYKSKLKSRYDYELLLPQPFNDLEKTLKMSLNEVDWSILKGKFSSGSLRLSLEGYLSFDNSGQNTSEEFDVAFESETKLNGLDLTPLNEKLSAWPYYPESNGSPVPVSQTISFDLMVQQHIRAMRDSSLRYNEVKFVRLKDNESKILREAMSRGRAGRVIENTIYNAANLNDLDGKLDKLGVQYTLEQISFRGRGLCAFSPLGQATRLVTSQYASGYKKPLLSGFLSLSVPALLLATGYSAWQQMDFQKQVNRSQPNPAPGDVTTLAAIKRDTAVLAAITGALISIDFSLGLHFSNKNMAIKRRFRNLMRDDYPNGFSFVFSNT